MLCDLILLLDAVLVLPDGLAANLACGFVFALLGLSS
jgi:hypothetical protein